MFRIEETTYQKIYSEWPEVSAEELGFLKDWSNLISGLVYFSILNEKNGSMQGAFCVCFSKRKGMEHVSNPPFFQNCGLVIKNQKTNNYEKQSLTKRVIKSVSEFLNGFNWVNVSLPHKFTDAQPFIWDGFTVSPRYTYLLDIRNDEAQLARHFSKGLKNDLSNCSKSEIAFSDELSEDVLQFLAVTSAEHRAEAEQKTWRNIMESTASDSHTITTTAHYQNYRGTVCVMQAGETGVYMFGNSDKDSPLALNSVALMKTIGILKSRGVTTLDFEGSMISGIERYFRSFGGELTPYFNILKEPKLIKTAKFLKG